MDEISDVDRVSAFLDSAARGPAALLIEGEVGIGKTTAWLDAAEEARRAGFRVLSARASRQEGQVTFGVASQLIGDVEPEVTNALPRVQRMALQRTLHAAGEHSGGDQRAVVAAFTAIVNGLSDVSPVLVAIDDVQWLDVASRDLLAFAARRLRGRVGLLLTELSGPDGAAAWLTLDRPDALSRMRIRPMDVRRLQRLVSDRVGRSYPRPTMMRIADVSGGNPFYALELARSVCPPALAPTTSLPPALAEIIHRRIGHFGDEVKRALLAAACVDDPTVDVMAAMTSTSVDGLVALLEEPETHGVVTIEGNRVRFTHPVLAYGVYGQALPADRRRMHRVLAGLDSAPERRARHMALAVVSPDPATLAALDVAAIDVAVKGDPVAAAELVELAIGLGGDTASRRIEAARHHLRAGDLDRCRMLADAAVAVLPAGEQRAAVRLLIAGTHLCHGDFDSATEVLALVMADAGKRSPLLLRAHLCAAMAQSSLGNGDAAQRHSVQAMTRAEETKDPHLISQSLAVHAGLQCHGGHGPAGATLDRAIRLENVEVDTPAPFSAQAISALVLAWSGRLTEAEARFTAVLERSTARGAESDLPWLQFHAAMVDVGLGRYAHAALTAQDASLRAERIGSAHFRLLAGVPTMLAAAYTGREAAARKEIEGALADASTPAGQWTTPWPIMTLGFLEVSLGNYAEALNALQPLLTRWQKAVDVDIATFYFVPDAVEAAIALDDLTDVEELVTSLERTGARLHHPWMSAVGARSRSMLMAARGDLDAAERAALMAMAMHARLASPFERARTQLVLGQVQRQMRRRQAARTTLEDALSTFRSLGTPIWAARAEGELKRVSLLKGHDSELTPAEQRVAELAATGMTNRDVAAALFISPKTVESNLGRVYRKLGISSRVELGRRLNADGRGSSAMGQS